MVKEILVLLDELLSSKIAVLVEEIDLEDLFSIGRIGVGKDIPNQEGEDVSEGPVSEVGAEDVVVVTVEELTRHIRTNNPVIPPAYAQYLDLSITGNGI